MTKLWRGLCKNWQVFIGLAWFFGTGSLPFWVPSVSPTLKVSPESLRGLGLYLLGTGTAPLGLYLTYSRTASLRSQTDNEKDKNVTDAFAKSAELLDSKTPAGRQGGIYALGKIAKDNSEQHSTIMKIMTSYIRGETYRKFHERCEEECLKDEQLIDKLAKEPMPSDIEAAIEVIRERQIDNDESLKSDEAAIEVIRERQTNNDESLKSDEKKSFKPKFDLSNSYVFNADFSATNLSNTNFSDSIMFGCCFDRTDLSESSFVSSNLQGSSFVDSKFKKCEFKETNFQECDLSDSEFENCDLTDVKNLTQEQIDSVKIDEYTKSHLPKLL